jgi:putative hydrolase of the HAD superfamily
MREAYRHLDVPAGISSYGDEGYIKTLPVVKILVTSGYKKFQTQKNEILGIADLFSEIIIDELDHKGCRKGKRAIFAELLGKYNWNATEVLVVGDNPASELKAAKALGIPTVQTLRPTIVKWDQADHHIASLKELAQIFE